MTSIDRLDVEILERLAQTARAGVAELAGALGVSRATVQQRLKRLEDEGVFQGFRPMIDLRAAGLSVHALITVEIDQRVLDRVVAGLANLPEVLEVRIQAGREDLLVHVALTSLEALQSLTTDIVAIEGVRKTTSTFTVATPIPYRSQPILRKVTAHAGWGRSASATRRDVPADDRQTGGPASRTAR
ncbi:Lrp/AsnC family transcriptional regulator [Agromyces aerolatus]|uniref:Lrp/AsnC family transcriptional regulator n=1 Tax=Agromyces sp. LY-1074 TaxID=3074080 RepID=UPI002858500F|nr:MULTISPECIES: Lrp/AsnC family transcriptional regulator [unclassified Agromyces]MDR5701873.1 Lrp/AsnC family transcriptional regulator [Agromyces sp. LY-1074]MDR5708113.1 Lrp/AsnC family transcriptional regulator [Agromyces sp. LY-1358]